MNDQTSMVNNVINELWNTTVIGLLKYLQNQQDTTYEITNPPNKLEISMSIETMKYQNMRIRDIWAAEFTLRFVPLYNKPYKWRILPMPQETLSEMVSEIIDGVDSNWCTLYSENSKMRFECKSCLRCWTVLRSKLLWSTKFVSEEKLVEIYFTIFHSMCNNCDLPSYPLLYPEEVIRMVYNLSLFCRNRFSDLKKLGISMSNWTQNNRSGQAKSPEFEVIRPFEAEIIARQNIFEYKDEYSVTPKSQGEKFRRTGNKMKTKIHLFETPPPSASTKIEISSTDIPTTENLENVE
ncbi:hypothetical protein SNEBB_009715 [Seison nebaliae]|nr:hypothetical protein SNEBB_009715 [Seison nebaliae]